MDDLIRQLNELQIERDDAAREYQRTVAESSRRERTLLANIQRQRQQQQQRRDNPLQNNIRNNRRNPIVTGDIVRITNDCSPRLIGHRGSRYTRHQPYG